MKAKLKEAGAFWRSVNLTGNQTGGLASSSDRPFWRSVNLTGNQTDVVELSPDDLFWRSVNLTGNQTDRTYSPNQSRFGAVSI